MKSVVERADHCVSERCVLLGLLRARAGKAVFLLRARAGKAVLL